LFCFNTVKQKKPKNLCGIKLCKNVSQLPKISVWQPENYFVTFLLREVHLNFINWEICLTSKQLSVEYIQIFCIFAYPVSVFAAISEISTFFSLPFVPLLTFLQIYVKIIRNIFRKVDFICQRKA